MNNKLALEGYFLIFEAVEKVLDTILEVLNEGESKVSRNSGRSEGGECL